MFPNPFGGFGGGPGGGPHWNPLLAAQQQQQQQQQQRQQNWMFQQQHQHDLAHAQMAAIHQINRPQLHPRNPLFMRPQSGVGGVLPVVRNPLLNAGNPLLSRVRPVLAEEPPTRKEVTLPTRKEVTLPVPEPSLATPLPVPSGSKMDEKPAKEAPKQVPSKEVTQTQYFNQELNKKREKWPCQKCGGQNWPDRIYCFRCRTPKTSETSSNQRKEEPRGSTAPGMAEKPGSSQLKPSTVDDEKSSLISNDIKPVATPAITKTVSEPLKPAAASSSPSPAKPQQPRSQDQGDKVDMAKTASNNKKFWVCNHCKCMNMLRVKNCQSCHRTATAESKSATALKEVGDLPYINQPHDNNKKAIAGNLGKYPPNKKVNDWPCPNPKCNNINFAWRTACNRCKTPKGEIVAPNSNKSGENRNESNSRQGNRSIQNDSAAVTSSFKSDFSDHQQQPKPPNKFNQDRPSSSSYRSDDILPHFNNQSRFNNQNEDKQSLVGKSHSALQNRDTNWDKQQQKEDDGGETFALAKSSSLSQQQEERREQDQLLAKEAEFDKMFETWDKNFNQWQVDNANNPDKNYVRKHLEEMNKLRERMVQRRENLKQKRHEILESRQQREQEQIRQKEQQRIEQIKQKELELEVKRQEEKLIRDQRKTRDGAGSRWSGDAEESKNIDQPVQQTNQYGYSTKRYWDKSNKYQQSPVKDTSATIPNQTFPSFGDSSTVGGIPGLGDGKDDGEPEKPKPFEIAEEKPKFNAEKEVGFSQAVKGYQETRNNSKPWNNRPDNSWSSSSTSENVPRSNFHQQNFEREENRRLFDNSVRNQTTAAKLSPPRQQEQQIDEENLFTKKSELSYDRYNDFQDDGISMFQRKRSEEKVWNPTNVIDYNDVSPAKQPKLAPTSSMGGESSSSFSPNQPKLFDYSHRGQGNKSIGPSGFNSDFQFPKQNQKEEKKIFDYSSSQFQQPHRETEQEPRQVFNYEQSSYETFPGYHRHQQRGNKFHEPKSIPPAPKVNFGGNSLGQPNPASSYQSAEYFGQESNSDFDQIKPVPSTAARRTNYFSELQGTPPPVAAVPIAKPEPPRSQTFQVQDLFEPPGRYVRPPKMVIILRGLPGSGKSYLAKIIKAKETDLGSEPPRILCLDDYFECDGEYEYEAELEPSFRQSLIRSFKKQIDDGYFNFLVVDCVNDKTEYYEEMWSYAKQNGFEAYICEVVCDPTTCASRNIHKRSSAEIKLISEKWEKTPPNFNKLDSSGFLDEKEESPQEEEKAEKVSEMELDDKMEEDEDSKNSEETSSALSKWEVMDNDLQKAQLDGVSEKARKRMAEHDSIEDWLELSSTTNQDLGKKRVRWADIEERREQMKMREVGFVVGQTNWNRMMDQSKGQSALTRTKIIPNRFDNK